MKSNLCPTCGESKTVKGARFEHVRLGLDEAPEPVLCKCKKQSDYLTGIMRRMQDVERVVSMSGGMSMSQVMMPDINPFRVEHVDAQGNLEVEIRINPLMSESVYVMMSQGRLGTVLMREITEVGCSCWVGVGINSNAKIRIRSNGEQVIKVPMEVYSIAPGVKLAISHEYTFEGTITRPDYEVKMKEMSVKMKIEGIPVNIIARMYEVEGINSYSAEIELLERVTDLQLRMMMSWFINVFGSVRSISNEIDPEFMSMVRSADHAVVDVSDMTTYRGTFMYKADGMKVYIFCYTFGYIITLTDSSLSVISYRFTHAMQPICEMTKMPDVMVAEMMMDGSLIYIDTLARGGEVVEFSRPYVPIPITLCQRPSVMIRPSWKRIPSLDSRVNTTMPCDGIVCVTPFRTLRLKEPTVDLKYIDGQMCTIDAGAPVPLAQGDRNMVEGMIYEFKLYRASDPTKVILGYPVERMSKMVPNNMEIIRRAVASVSGDPQLSTSLFDITSMSFSMRSRVYEAAQASASLTRKVIVVFGCGRMQEWKQMRLSNFSYVAIDPDVDVSRLSKLMRKVTVMPYDPTTKFSVNIMSISKRPGQILYYKGTSEDFILRSDVMSFMNSNRIPAVFSFSISYHIGVINTLKRAGIDCYGCGFVHDGMGDGIVGSPPVTMTRRRSPGPTQQVVATFGKSTYVEPFLSIRSVSGLKLVREMLKDIWANVDSSTVRIMERAVIMTSSRT